MASAQQLLHYGAPVANPIPATNMEILGWEEWSANPAESPPAHAFSDGTQISLAPASTACHRAWNSTPPALPHAQIDATKPPEGPYKGTDGKMYRWCDTCDKWVSGENGGRNASRCKCIRTRKRKTPVVDRWSLNVPRDRSVMPYVTQDASADELGQPVSTRGRRGSARQATQVQPGMPACLSDMPSVDSLSNDQLLSELYGRGLRIEGDTEELRKRFSDHIKAATFARITSQSQLRAAAFAKSKQLAILQPGLVVEMLDKAHKFDGTRFMKVLVRTDTGVYIRGFVKFKASLFKKAVKITKSSPIDPGRGKSRTGKRARESPAPEVQPKKRGRKLPQVLQVFLKGQAGEGLAESLLDEQKQIQDNYEAGQVHPRHVDSMDTLTAVLKQFKAKIVHFGAHGDRGLLTAAQLPGIVAQHGAELIVLNACDSEGIGKKIRKQCKSLVVCWRGDVKSSDCEKFAGSLYSLIKARGLVEAKTVQSAVNQGLDNVQLLK
eukprot:SAG25_NODE_93_length_16012_cov_22.660341_9_plen_494_part_00